MCGGQRLDGGGYFLRPAVFADARPRMRLVDEEIFGPVAVVLPFDTEAEAIALANDTIYGLSGSLWTNDLKRGVRVAQAVRTGVLSVNSSSSANRSRRRIWTARWSCSGNAATSSARSWSIWDLSPCATSWPPCPISCRFLWSRLTGRPPSPPKSRPSPLLQLGSMESYYKLQLNAFLLLAGQQFYLSCCMIA